MISYRKLKKGSTYKARGIIKWNAELGSYVVGNNLNFIIQREILDNLYALAMRYSESGGLLFFELSNSPPRTLVAIDIIEINNISSNPWSEFSPDSVQVTELILERTQKRKLVLPAFFHIHPVKDEYTDIQSDFYMQAGPSEADIASTFWTYPYLQDGKLSLPEFIICKHPSEAWMFVGFYDSIRHRAIEIQKRYLQQELWLSVINKSTPYLKKAKKKINDMSFLEMAGYGALSYIGYKTYEPQIKSAIDKAGDIISAELNLKIVETQMAAFGHVPFYTIARPGQDCFITLPSKGHQKKITKMTSKPRVTSKAIKEFKKLIR